MEIVLQATNLSHYLTPNEHVPTDTTNTTYTSVYVSTQSHRMYS